MTLVVFAMLFFCRFSSIVSSQRLHFHHVGPCHGVNLVAVPDGYKSPKKTYTEVSLQNAPPN